MDAPLWREMPEWKLSSLEKDSFHSGISLQKGASVLRYGFSTIQKMFLLKDGLKEIFLQFSWKIVFKNSVFSESPTTRIFKRIIKSFVS